MYVDMEASGLFLFKIVSESHGITNDIQQSWQFIKQICLTCVDVKVSATIMQPTSSFSISILMN